MSKVTNPEQESSVSCGFYNSLNDRKYDAIQMSKLFDGIINDGIFASIGDCLIVSADSGNFVNVGTGKAWFNHTWTENDSILPIECDQSELLLDRIDAIVLEIDSNEDVRDNFIKFVKGTPASEPARPTMSSSGNIYQYALCYIERKANSTEITQADITNVVGTDDTPFITGLMETLDSDELLKQWAARFDDFMNNEANDVKETILAISELRDSEEQSFTEWFANIKDELDGDTAGKLQNQIDKSDVERMLLVGLTDGQKTFSDDGTEIITVDSSGRTLTKVFTNGFLTCTSTLKDKNGVLMGEMVKTFSSDGSVIDTTVNIV